jgi:aspartate beta-hydroxylase
VSTTPISDADARTLADTIDQEAQRRPKAEAMKLIEMALARAPRHARVLNSVGGYLYRTGDAARAREIFGRAVAVDANAQVVWLNLAASCCALGDTAAEGAAIERALALDPRYLLALLQKGDLMERLGKPKAAALVYTAALSTVAQGTQLPSPIVTKLEHAEMVVQANRRELEAFLEQEVAAVRQQHGGTDQRRYDACRDLYLGKRRVYYSAPGKMLFPYLPAIEFFPRDHFPWLEALEAATDDIAAEAENVLASDRSGFAPYVDFPPDAPVDQWAGLNHSMDWSVYSLWRDGVRFEDHIAKCPKTAAVLAQLPLCDIPTYAPCAFFSVLKPRTHLPAHTGTTNTRSIVHLPLVIPDGCRFRVGSDTRPWRKGTAWVFDDTIEHEAWNDSGQTRIILICDIWNPLLTAAERDLVRGLTVGAGRYYGVDAPEFGTR